MDNAIKLIKQRGTTLLEALVATAIISVGFIAIFQMVTYSVSSIDVSGERTKINYLADMVLEDLNAYKNSENATSEKLYDALIDNRLGPDNAFWEGVGCAAGPGIADSENNAEANIVNIWNNRFTAVIWLNKTTGFLSYLFLTLAFYSWIDPFINIISTINYTITKLF